MIFLNPGIIDICKSWTGAQRKARQSCTSLSSTYMLDQSLVDAETQETLGYYNRPNRPSKKEAWSSSSLCHGCGSRRSLECHRLGDDSAAPNADIEEADAAAAAAPLPRTMGKREAAGTDPRPTGRPATDELHPLPWGRQPPLQLLRPCPSAPPPHPTTPPPPP